MIGQPRPFITIETKLLSRPPQPAMPGQTHTTEPVSTQVPATDFIGSLRQLLPSYLLDGAPSIDLVAEIADTSTRSLQRYLKTAGLNYRDLLEQVRYDIATRLLSRTDDSIMGIARTLGYADATHFARAFRRLAGVSPKQFRQLQRLQ